jgi:hypothetical protein
VAGPPPLPDSIRYIFLTYSLEQNMSLKALLPSSSLAVELYKT